MWTVFSKRVAFQKLYLDNSKAKVYNRQDAKGIAMSNREKIVELLDIIPDYKIGYVLAYVQGMAADEEADDIFCQRMMENYENAPDEDKENIPLEKCLKEWGLG